MNKYLITASALAMLVAGPALAANDAKMPANASGNAAVETSVKAAATQQQSGQIDSNELIGRDIQNAAGETVGEVNSVILGQDGKADAVIVGVGGFLGIGERDVAINWDDLSIANDSDEIVANVTREQLEQMPEYTFADEQRRGTAFESDMAAGRPAMGTDARERMVGTSPTMQGEKPDVTVNADRNVDLDVNKRGVDARTTTMAAGDANLNRDNAARSETAEMKDRAANAQSMDNLSQLSAEEFIGRDVVNLRGDEVGEVEDLVVDQDKAVFAVISVGGFLGMGDKNVTVPIDQLKLGENELIMTSETTEDQLKDMPAYDKEAYQPFDRNQPITR